MPSLTARNYADALLLAKSAYNSNSTEIQNVLSISGWEALSSDQLGFEEVDSFLYFPEGANSVLFSNENAQAIIAIKGDEIALAFRGTDEKKDWEDNFSSPENNFDEHYALLSNFIEAFWGYIERNGGVSAFSEITITGHSLGGALAEKFMASYGIVYRDIAPHLKGVVFASPGLSENFLGPVNLFSVDHTDDGVVNITSSASGVSGVGENLLVSRPEAGSVSNISITNFSSYIDEHSISTYEDSVANIFGYYGGSNFVEATFGTEISQSIENWYVTIGTGQRDEINAGSGRDAIFSKEGDDRIYGGGARDLIDLGAGHDEAFGEDGSDEIHGWAGNDSLYGGREDDSLFGGANDDFLAGEDNDDQLFGGLNNDRLYGDAGEDTLWGEGGNDQLFGGANNDTLHGGLGSDHLDGEGGSGDVAVFEYNWELYRPLSTTSVLDFHLELTQFDRSTDRVVSIEKLQFDNRLFNSVADYFDAYTDRFLTVAPIEENLPDPDPIENPDTPSSSPSGLPLMHVRGASIAEGDTGSRTLRFEVELGQASSTPVSFIYSATGGNSLGLATTGTDFEFAIDTIIFNPGETLKSIPITVFGDRLEEPDEYLNFLVSNVTGAELARGGAFVIEKGYIRDDDSPTAAEPDPEPEPPEEPDGPVYLTIESRDESQFEGSDGATVKYDFTVQRTGDLSQQTDFRIDVSGYGANAANSADFDGGSFPAISGSFDPGDDRIGVDIFVTSDTTQEADEYFEARLRSGDATAIVTNDRSYAAILNDDGSTLPPQGGEVYLSIRPLQSEILEGTSDTLRPEMQFEITRTGDLAQVTEFRLRELKLDYPTVADDQQDTFFLGTSPLFEIGETSYIADIRLRADAVNEPDELFTLRLSGVSDYPNTVILNEYASTLILNDDGPDPAQITSNAVAVMETNGLQVVQVPVHLSKVMPVDVSMAYEFRDRTNATPGEDFVTSTGVLTIPAGSVTANLNIEVLGDTTSEGLEGVQIRLEDPVNGYFGNSHRSAWNTGVVIFDDDVFPQASVPFDVITNRSVRVGELEKYSAIDLFFDLQTQTDLFAIEVEVAEPIPISSNSPAPVLIFDAGGNLLHANMSSFDYLDAGGVDGIGDNYVFPVGTYHLVYAVPETPVGFYSAQLRGSPAEGEVPILFPELKNGLNLNPTSLPFGAVGGMMEGGSPLVVGVKVSHGVDYDISYDIEFRSISATSDDLGGQTLIESKVLRANDSSEVSFVGANNDALPEPTELFEFVITNVVGALLPNGQSEYALPAVIFDNDVSPIAEFDIEDIGGSRAEGTGGSTEFEFSISRPEGQSGNLATVSWQVSGSGLNAASRFDFVGDQFPSGQLIFDIGETERVISVSVAGEAFPEHDESFTVRLSDPSDGFGLRTSTANAVIRNDDGVPDSPFYGDGVLVSSISYQMGDEDNDLVLTGAAPVYGVGNTKPNAISGNNAQNILEGREGNDELWGFDGDDEIRGGADADLIFGGRGGDLLIGGNGQDHIDGGAGTDRVSGGAGNDDLDVGAGNGSFQYADGGAGNDTYHYAKDAGRLYLSGETASSGSADRIVFSDLTLDDFTFDTLDYGPLPYGGDQVALRMLWNDGESSGELRVA
ncbi:Hemolysin-type calcium-binding repeat-containing protein, partial [Roseivivax lentus]